ncbi:MAG: TPR end-of-group domain-containing protein [Candidatus Thorarchaeota archaeon]|jgi:tetratricopeptide (TPR) repeat protein
MNDVDEITKNVVDLRKAKRLEEAEAILRTAIDGDSEAWQLWNQLGHILVATENYTEALSAFETATKLNPNGFWLWLSLGYVRKEMSRIEGAIDATLKATELGTKRHEIGSALYNLGCYNCIAGKYDEAIDYLDRAFQEDDSIKEWAREDSDLEYLKTNERFLRMLKSD